MSDSHTLVDAEELRAQVSKQCREPLRVMQPGERVVHTKSRRTAARMGVDHPFLGRKP